jgi:DNA (cytosine-5)-methyltransferase 1
MDTTQAITHLSLCAGYGGIDLGLKRAIPGLRTVAFSEIEAFACANLVAKMEAGQLDVAPVWTNLKTFPWHQFRGKVDILSGGYPCQPFSAAGKRLGKDDPRHLWPWIADGISILQPALCFFENVEGHISLGLSTVVSDLEGLGYKVAFGLFSAAEVGAPHQRKRIFVLAHRIGERGLVPHQWRVSGQQMPVRDGQTRGTFLADSIKSGSQGCAAEQTNAGGLQRTIGRGCNNLWPSRPGQPQHEWEPPRVVGNANCNQSRSQRADHGQVSEVSSIQRTNFGSDLLGGASIENVANARSIDGQRRGARVGRGKRSQSDAEAVQCAGNGYGQTEPTLGRNADGSAGRMDYAKLCVSGDNRTDELRLLGNGVVPATAAIAFTTLIQEMFP